MPDLALYCHIPFCRSRCSYCDFYSSTELGLLDTFVAALCWQAKALAADERWAKRSITSLYFGGGTPGLLSTRLPQILKHLRNCWDFASDCEVTLEVNPDSLTGELLEQWALAGITRLSVGVQSLDDAALWFLGRRHTAHAAQAALRLAKSAGLRVSADLICGLPAPFEESFTASLQQIVSLSDSPDVACEHFSIYPLTVEEETPLAQAIAAGQSVTPDEDRAAADMRWTQDFLQAYGFRHYEIANYALPGAESKHNLRYWTPSAQSGDYLGLGPAAASMRNLADDSRQRFILHHTLDDYLAKPERLLPAEEELLSPTQARREDIMLALRTQTGVSATAVEAAGLTPVIETLIRDNLLAGQANRYTLSERGWLLANEVFARIWCLDDTL